MSAFICVPCKAGYCIECRGKVFLPDGSEPRCACTMCNDEHLDPRDAEILGDAEEVF